jgi:hypothetical protein
MTRVKDGCQANARLQRPDYNMVEFVIDNMAGILVVNRIDALVITIVFIAILVLNLTSVARVVKEERVVRLGVLNKPVQGPNNVAPGGMHDRIGLVIGQEDHILSLVAIPLHQKGRDVLNVVDATA